MTSSPFEFPIEAGDVLKFARAINDLNPIYIDADHARNSTLGRRIVPPTYVAANAQYDPDYLLRWRSDRPWMGSGSEPTGDHDVDFSGGFHAEQHYEYHTAVGPGDVLTVESRPGRQWEKTRRDGGRLLFASIITEFRLPSGELAITSEMVAVNVIEP